MQKRKMRETDNRLYIDAEGLAAMLSCGKSTAIRVGEASGGKVKLGRSARYNVEKVRQYLAAKEASTYEHIEGK